MNKQVDIWNNVFKNVLNKKPEYDNWLEKYQGLIEDSKEIQIIDLGCGSGNNTLYLSERGYQVISCDFSSAAFGNS